MKSKRKSGKIPLVTAGEQNQGVAEFIAYDNELKIYENHLTIDMFCNCFYRNYKFLCDDNILVFLPKIDISNKSLLFMTSAINKDKAKFGYEKQYRQKSFAEHKIKLPITQNGEIDFDFMESFIAELEAERVRELEAYLKASGLSDTTLSPDEKSALNTWNSRIWQEFRIGDFFDIRNTTGLNTDKLNDGLEYDYITRTSNNQGILQTTGLVNQSNLNEAGVWSLGLLQMDFFYRKRQWYAGQFVRKIIPKIKLSKNAILFFTTLLNCQKKILLSVLVRNVDETFKNLKIQLPITANGEIDFDFMESFIKAIQKESIKGVDSYLAKNIATTKEVINN
ncbi:MAG: restriction endonuclease subunit S [Campylobacter sp.]|nr:restriction endonuclease subunit S [Campylobacter sp.]